jgi:hypothetical protein
MVAKKKKGKRGRPKKPGGHDPVIAVRVSKPVVVAIDAKAKAEGSTRSRTAAAMLTAAALSDKIK